MWKPGPRCGHGAGPVRVTATTRHGLVRIDKDGQHVGIVKQGRWGLLTAAYEAEDVCRTELTRGVPSAQFWTQVQGVLAAD